MVRDIGILNRITGWFASPKYTLMVYGFFLMFDVQSEAFHYSNRHCKSKSNLELKYTLVFNFYW
jgi:hypothetical protein